MPTVLLVDDEYAIIEVLSSLLVDEGFRVIAAANGEEALARLAEEVPDVVLLDVMMPRIDGRETLRAIRDNPAWKHLPVVLMSAAREALAGTADERVVRLQKPFELDALLRAIRTLQRP